MTKSFRPWKVDELWLLPLAPPRLDYPTASVGHFLTADLTLPSHLGEEEDDGVMARRGSDHGGVPEGAVVA
ncbi:hypothetical protein [Belnapia rosea]|uniref:hypothetical protein n=1 Tax=Belnapia rosea TaxID=938405 RepID=UPI0008824C40|nr:hypothetical protein [Belnapia rosea]SDB74951.1 hypothetical protein SAMN02927895_05654 [Belnapia rosea]